MSRNSSLKSSTRVDRATIVDSRRAVKVSVVRPSGLVNAIRQPISGVSPSGALADHLLNDRCGTWVLDYMGDIRVASSVSIMVLHQPWVADAIVACWSSDAATGLLQDNCKNETVINACLGCYLLDGIPNSALSMPISKR